MIRAAICIPWIFVWAALGGDKMTHENPGEKQLAQIEYDVGGRYTETRWISEKRKGSTRDIPGQAALEVSQDDPNALQEAAECLKLLKSVEQPKELPDDPRRIVTVRCADGDAIVVKRFPAGNVPQEVRGMLLAMGYACGARGFDVLTFVATPEAGEEADREQRQEELEALEKEARSVASMNNDYARAVELYTKALELAPKSTELLMKRAGMHEANGEPDAAAADYGEVIQLDPKNEEAYKLRAFAYRKKGMREKAAEAYTAWIAFNPKAALAYEERGFLFLWRDDDKLIADMSQAIALYSQGIGEVHTTPYTMRAEAYARKGEREKAIADYTEAIQIDPDWAASYSGRAGLYFDEGDYDKGFADYDKAAELAPKDLNKFMDRGYAYYQRGEWDKALADVDSVMKLKPGWINAVILRGNIYSAQGKYEEAMKEFDDAIGQSDRVVSGYNAAAWLMATCPDEKFRDGAKALEYAEKACEIGTWHWDGNIDTLAAAYAESGKWEDAVNYENLAIKVGTANREDAGTLKGYAERAALYAQKKPYRETKGVPGN
ncbi:MAG TPA: tetratricopeptide repeat protein [Chthoniobacteraceae bacterium]|nr:tetratricopeptide repeat protein [Chthoniobacteraceae bacterium]